jgi:hypothetical protein
MNLDLEEVLLLVKGSVNVNVIDQDKKIDLKRVLNGCALDVHF